MVSEWYGRPGFTALPESAIVVSSLGLVGIHLIPYPTRCCMAFEFPCSEALQQFLLPQGASHCLYLSAAAAEGSGPPSPDGSLFNHAWPY